MAVCRGPSEPMPSSVKWAVTPAQEVSLGEFKELGGA